MNFLSGVCEVENKQRRADDALRKKKAGLMAYSNEFEHIFVRLGGVEHGINLARAIQLRDALEKAISTAAIPDNEYT
jgi:hypothetical protein